MEDFPSNSRVDREAAKSETGKKDIQKVTTGEVKMRRKPLSKRFVELFIGGDTQGVGAYIVQDVLVPAFKDTVSDVITQAVERTLFGDVRTRSGGRNRGGPSGYVSYNRYGPANNAARREEPRREVSQRGRANHDFKEIVLETRVEGEQVLSSLYSILENYQVVSVADFYSICGVNSSFIDEKWGWEDLSGSAVVRTRGGGYLVDLPAPKQLS